MLSDGGGGGGSGDAILEKQYDALLRFSVSRLTNRHADRYSTCVAFAFSRLVSKPKNLSKACHDPRQMELEFPTGNHQLEMTSSPVTPCRLVAFPREDPIEGIPRLPVTCMYVWMYTCVYMYLYVCSLFLPVGA